MLLLSKQISTSNQCNKYESLSFSFIQKKNTLYLLKILRKTIVFVFSFSPKNTNMNFISSESTIFTDFCTDLFISFHVICIHIVRLLSFFSPKFIKCIYSLFSFYSFIFVMVLPLNPRLFENLFR